MLEEMDTRSGVVELVVGAGRDPALLVTGDGLSVDGGRSPGTVPTDGTRGGGA